MAGTAQRVETILGARGRDGGGDIVRPERTLLQCDVSSALRGKRLALPRQQWARPGGKAALTGRAFHGGSATAAPHCGRLGADGDRVGLEWTQRRGRRVWKRGDAVRDERRWHEPLRSRQRGPEHGLAARQGAAARRRRRPAGSAVSRAGGQPVCGYRWRAAGDVGLRTTQSLADECRCGERSNLGWAKRARSAGERSSPGARRELRLERVRGHAAIPDRTIARPRALHAADH